MDSSDCDRGMGLDLDYTTKTRQGRLIVIVRVIQVLITFD